MSGSRRASDKSFPYSASLFILAPCIQINQIKHPQPWRSSESQRPHLDPGEFKKIASFFAKLSRNVGKRLQHIHLFLTLWNVAWKNMYYILLNFHNHHSLCNRNSNSMELATDKISGLQCLIPAHYWVVIWPWAMHLTSQSFNFLTCPVWVIRPG